MKKMLMQIDEMEQELNKVQEQADYWLVEEHYDEAKSEQYEQEGDSIYEKLYDLIENAADQIISITLGRVDKNYDPDKEDRA